MDLVQKNEKHTSEQFFTEPHKFTKKLPKTQKQKKTTNQETNQKMLAQPEPPAISLCTAMKTEQEKTN